MTTIVVAIIIAIVLFMRSIENVVANPSILEMVDRYHVKTSIFTREILKSTFSVASKTIVLKSVGYFSILLFGILMLEALLFGVVTEIKGEGSISARPASIVVLYCIFVFAAIKFGAFHSFKDILLFIKGVIVDLLKSKFTWLFLGVVYFILILCFSAALMILSKSLCISVEEVFDNVLNQEYKIVIEMLVYPLVVVLGAVLIIAILLFILWCFSRFGAFVFYHIMKKIFKFSYFLNRDKPLKPLLLVAQILILVLTPIFGLIIEYFL